ncbi:MAG: sigma-70 family RNA polymerase sigma factor [Planctomycetota bacterium]
MTDAGDRQDVEALSRAGARDDDTGPDRAAFDDPAELQRLWREHRRWVAAILLAHKPREVDVEDLLQTVAVSVVRKVGELRDPRAFKPWLRTVAINAARAAGRQTQRGRKKLRLAREAAVAGSEGTESSEGASADREEGRRLLELARTMPDGYREPLLLRCVQGMSYRQISEVTGLPETTIETRIARGRRMLRQLASQQGDSAAEAKPEKTKGRAVIRSLAV